MNRLARIRSSFSAFSGARAPRRALLPLTTALWAASLFTSHTAFAADPAPAEPAPAEPAANEVLDPTNPLLGMDPSAPNSTPLPGGTLPTDVAKSSGAGDWRFGFHGFLSMPM